MLYETRFVLKATSISWPYSGKTITVRGWRGCSSSKTNSPRHIANLRAMNESIGPRRVHFAECPPLHRRCTMIGGTGQTK